MLVNCVFIFISQTCTGYYPHPSVTQCPGVSNVQKEVVYCPDLKFCAFDIAITTYGEQEQSRRKYLSISLA